MTSIAYPSSLPMPQSAPFQSTERRVIAPPGGPYDVRALQRDRHGEQNVTFPPMNAADTAAFVAWWKDDLTYGGAKFAATWPLPWGTVPWTRRFIDTPHYEFLPTPQGNYWRISATFEVLGRGELPQTPHICEGGPVWSATVRPSGQSLGLVYLGSHLWVATGLGQSGTTPSPTLRSEDNGHTWIAGGTIPNVSNAHPQGLCYAPSVGSEGRLVCYTVSQATTSWSGDRGLTWNNENQATFVPIDLKFANGLFVFVNDSVIVPSAGVKTYSSANGLLPYVANATPAQAASIHWITAKSYWIIFERGGDGIWTSPDLQAWTLRGANPQGDGAGISLYNVAQNGLHIVATYTDGTPVAIVSHDGGETWANSGSLIQSGVNCIAYGNGIFICSTTVAGQSSSSMDNGDTWDSANPFTESKGWIFRNDGHNTWVAVGGDGSNDTVANLGVC